MNLAGRRPTDPLDVFVFVVAELVPVPAVVTVHRISPPRRMHHIRRYATSGRQSMSRYRRHLHRRNDRTQTEVDTHDAEPPRVGAVVKVALLKPGVAKEIVEGRIASLSVEPDNADGNLVIRVFWTRLVIGSTPLSAALVIRRYWRRPRRESRLRSKSLAISTTRKSLAGDRPLRC